MQLQLIDVMQCCDYIRFSSGADRGVDYADSTKCKVFHLEFHGPLQETSALPQSPNHSRRLDSKMLDSLCLAQRLHSGMLCSRTLETSLIFSCFNAIAGISVRQQARTPIVVSAPKCVQKSLLRWQRIPVKEANACGQSPF